MDSYYEKHEQALYFSRDLPFIYHRDRYARTEPGVPFHWHENPEFLRCLTGTGTLSCVSESYAFEAGDLVCIAPNTPHSIRCTSETPLCYDCLIIELDFCEKNGLRGEELRFATRICDKAVRACFDRIPAAFSETRNRVLRTRTAVLDLLNELAARYLSEDRRTLLPSGLDVIKAAVIYIRENYSKPLSLEEVSRVSGLSPCYFSHEFKRLTGIPFSGFLNQIRCENAGRLLQGGARVSEACFACGFRDLSYFSRTFSRIMGVSPGHYRGER